MGSGFYHCTSRVVDRMRRFGEVEKEKLVRYMRLYERLYGLRVVTYCVMDNHFHILLEVPQPPKVMPSNEELIGLIRETHGDRVADCVRGWFVRWEEQGSFGQIEEERTRWFNQMWDLSHFIKIVKQRFTQWFNGTRGEARRVGTLWEGRFRSTLVEDGEALQTIAAYIDLNPVRAGMVKDPKDYRWSGYGEACAGQARAQAGLMRAAQASDFTRGVKSAEEKGVGHSLAMGFELLPWYREQLFGRGLETHDAGGKLVRRGFTEEEIQAVRDVGGRLPRHVYLRQRVRYFSDGFAIGSRAFVEAIFQARRDCFSSKRTTAARRLKGLELASTLRVARDLAVRPTG